MANNRNKNRKFWQTASETADFLHSVNQNRTVIEVCDFQQTVTKLLNIWEPKLNLLKYCNRSFLTLDTSTSLYFEETVKKRIEQTSRVRGDRASSGTTTRELSPPWPMTHWLMHKIGARKLHKKALCPSYVPKINRVCIWVPLKFKFIT